MERKWIGNIDEKNRIAYNLKHNFKFNIYSDSGLNKTLWENVKDKFYEIPGTIFFEILKFIILALLAVVLIKLGISIDDKLPGK